MKHLQHILILSAFIFAIAKPCNVEGQLISTIAGDGTAGYSGDGGPASMAKIGDPYAIAMDKKQNIYLTDVLGNKIRKITSAGVISTIGGIASAGYNGDGIPATTASFNEPTGIVTDTVDNVFIVDKLNNRVRKIDAVTGIITTIAGNGTAGYAGDGLLATASVLNSPEDICFDKAGNLYILDNGNYRIRKINTLGKISTVAGNGINGFGGDGGAATAANIQDMSGICADAAGNLYFSQRFGKRVRKISITGKLTTIAGNGFTGPSGDGGSALDAALDPERLTMDRGGNLYVSGYANNNVRIINTSGVIQTIAGHVTAGFSGDGGLAILAELNTPIGIVLDTCGNLLIADKVNNRIRRVAINPLCVPMEVNDVQAMRLNIYPNPANSLLHIDNLQNLSDYRLQNILGATIQSGMLTKGDNNISLQALPAGIYMVEVSDTSTGQRAVSKLIKE